MVTYDTHYTRKMQTEIRINLAREHGHLKWNIDKLREGILKEIRIHEQGLFMSASSFPDNLSPPPNTTASFLTSTREEL